MRKRFNKIYIEITNVCNLECHFCPKTKRSPTFMSFDLFKKTIQESKPLCNEVTFHVMGEPLIHPKIKEFIEYCEDQEVSINLTTNGTLIEDKFDLLLNKSIRRINFSIHGIKTNFSQEKQEEYLNKIMDFTKLAFDKREDLIIIYRLWNINDESNKKIINLIESSFDIQLEEHETKKISTKIKNNSYIHYDNSFDWPDLNKKVFSTSGFCHGLSTHIGILADGSVVPCCLDNQGCIQLGNINDDSLNNILLSKRAVAMKKGFHEKRLVEDLCQRCTFIKRLEKNKIKRNNN